MYFPDYSRDKVYVSDIKKVAHWYNILHNLNLLFRKKMKEPVEEKGTDTTAKTEKGIHT